MDVEAACEEMFTRQPVSDESSEKKRKQKRRGDRVKNKKLEIKVAAGITQMRILWCVRGVGVECRAMYNDGGVRKY